MANPNTFMPLVVVVVPELCVHTSSAHTDLVSYNTVSNHNAIIRTTTTMCKAQRHELDIILKVGLLQL